MKEKTAADWAAFNDPVLEAFRANDGKVPGRGPILLLTTRGRRTGEPRLTPLNYSRAGDAYVVIGSKGGSPTHPAWFLNLLADPEVTIEVGTETFRARARVAEEPERTRLYDAQAELMPFFDGYRKRTREREIPVVVFDRIAED
ncbi:MAG: nitroreductase/quinone reductase family protein [Chloroflexota bacterium]